MTTPTLSGDGKLHGEADEASVADHVRGVMNAGTSAQANRPVHTVSGGVECIAASQITDELCADWDAIRKSRSSLATPFFSHQFVRAVSKHLPDVEVGVQRENGRVVAIFPFQRFRKTIARPVGAGINDAHGVMQLSDYPVSTVELMSGLGLRSFPFHAAPLDLPDIARFEIGRTRAFLADLTVDPQGYEHYLSQTSNTISRQGQKTRRMIRELGPLRFEFDCRDEAMLQRLVDLKCEQYQRTHTFNILGVPWIRQLLTDLHRDQSSAVRGLLNVLYAGDHPVALHYGMIEGDLLHYWFPVFDPVFSFGSPGTQLFLDVAREAIERGYRAIDMGYGEQGYKYKLTNVISEMSYGIIDESPIRRIIYRNKRALRERWKQLKFKDAIKPLARRLMPGFGKSSY